MASGIVTLTTDFGLDDPFAGIMKGVILVRNPKARIVDLTHGIPPGDGRSAAIALHAAFHFFPKGTVHTVVVDPGVGSGRRIVVGEAEGHLFLAPDTGIIPAVLDPFGETGLSPIAVFRSVDAPQLYLPQVSATFHGRDIFSPVAAALAGGLATRAIGPVIHDPARITFPRPVRDGRGTRGEVIHVDRFGNLVTNLRGDDLPGEGWSLNLLGRTVDGPAPAYAAVAPGAPLSLIGSGGFLEISVRDGNAAETLGAGVGTPLQVEPNDENRLL